MVEQAKTRAKARHFLIGWLKTRAPFWKLEESPEGAAWVEAKTSDNDDAARWREKSDKAAE